MWVGVRECVESTSSIGLREPFVFENWRMGDGRVMVSTLTVGSAFSFNELMTAVGSLQQRWFLGRGCKVGVESRGGLLRVGWLL